MIPRPFEDVSESDLESLVANEIAEQRTLEFKRDLNIKKDGDRLKFVQNISSFANAQGGDILYGIDAPKGVAIGISGIQDADRDAVILDLEDLLISGVQPRITGLRSRWIACGDRRHVLLIRVPASTIAPHRVIYKGDNSFYGRKSNGKYPMDTAELREAFTASEALPTRLRALHLEAVDAVHRDLLPIGVGDNPHAILSLIPTTYFRELRDLPITRETALAPFKPEGYLEAVPMIEGILLHNIPDAPRAMNSFAITHRQGRVDTGWTLGRMSDSLNETGKFIAPDTFENGVLDGAISGTTRLQPHGVDGPWLVLVTLSGIRDYQLGAGGSIYSPPAWRDELTLPPLMIETMNRAALLPMMRSFWLAFGVERPEHWRSALD